MGLYLCPCRADCDLFGRFDRQQYPAEIGMLTGQVVPDNTAVYAKDFKPESVLGESNLSFRGNVNIAEGQSADVVFLNADNGMLVQVLPFSVKLKKFPYRLLRYRVCRVILPATWK